MQDELIRRQAVLDLAKKGVLISNGSYKSVCKAINEILAVDPTKKGHWIIKDGKEQGYDIGGIKTWYIQIVCSECGFIKTAIEGHIGQYHYCPNCGAKIQEV